MGKGPLDKGEAGPYDSFPRYLRAKKTVDDRALNAQVWARLAEELVTGVRADPLQVLEVGAGIGTMVQRVLERRLIENGHYTALDAEGENIEYARENLPAWTQSVGFDVQHASKNVIRLQKTGQQLTLSLVTGDIFGYLPPAAPSSSWDLLIAHAFLDLVDLDRALPLLLEAVRPGGLVYFTINFDGVTIFDPVIDPVLDQKLMALYHQTMDERLVGGRLSGDSHTGRRLFEALDQRGVEVLAAGSSDWVVFPSRAGYMGDEAYFLHFIVETVRGALEGRPGLDPEGFAAWIARRHDQIRQKTLRLIVHQLDFLGRKRM